MKMKKVSVLLIVLLLLTGFSSCEFWTALKNEDAVCYEFDQRQCGTDEWAELVPLNDSNSERETKMKAYLITKGIAVIDVKLDPDFHEAVCEACDVCPEEGRFFVKFVGEDLQEFEALMLLNSAAIDCKDEF